MSSPPIVVRAANGADAEAIAALHVRAWQWAYRGLIPDDYLDELSANLERRTERTRAQLAEPGEQRWWVAEQYGTICGFSITGPSEDEDASEGTGELLAIYLEREAVGKGIGRALFERSVEDLRERGYDVATLWVLETNARARKFYEAARWSPDGASKTEERPGAVLREVRYRKDLR